MTVMLEAHDLSLGYGTQTVVKDVSLEVKKGEFLAILGPNASGKTTLLKGLCGLIPSRGGGCFLEGSDLNLMPQKKIAQRMAYVSQKTHVPFSFTVHEIVRMGRTPYLGRFLSPHAGDEAIVESALRRTETWDLRCKTLDKISGGEVQRVVIARALAQTPRLLLLDEPTSHLDPGHERQILDLLLDLNRREEITIIMVSHDLNAALRVCSRALLLKDGKVFSSGSLSEVLTGETLSMVYETPIGLVQSSGELFIKHV